MARHLKLSDGSTWPLPAVADDDLAWRLTYGTPTREDILSAVSIIGAYGYLTVEANRTKRDLVAREVRAALKAQ